MRQGQQNRRGRGRGRKPQNPLQRNYESNGPDVKIRGNASHIAEKYMSLARDAHASGDAVTAESYLQHAEHYNRIIMAAQAGDQANGSGARDGGNQRDGGNARGRPNPDAAEGAAKAPEAEAAAAEAAEGGTPRSERGRGRQGRNGARTARTETAHAETAPAETAPTETAQAQAASTQDAPNQDANGAEPAEAPATPAEESKSTPDTVS